MTKIPFRAKLDGKVAVVTGGGGVLCSRFARALAACGAKVALLGRSEPPLNKVSALISDEGGEAVVVTADVTDKSSLIGAHDTIMSKLGPCDILINGAGGNRPDATTGCEYFGGEGKSFFELDEEAIRSVFDLNFTGTLLATQVFACDMTGRGGTVINISSMNAFRPLTKIPAYSAAKSAVGNLTQWLAVHFADAGIRVNAIAPGFFSSEQNRALLFNEDGSPSMRTQKILAATPMRRLGEPDDLIGALLFLADEECSRFVTGITLPVDGGFSAYSGV